jgi:uncharacterized protein YqgC (DUF456 family)
MDTIFFVLAVIAIVVGIVGCVLPIIPGIPLAFVAVLLYAWYDGFVSITGLNLVLLGTLTVLSIVSDYILIALGNRLMGSSKYSSIGAMLGVIVGFFIIPPLGILVFCFLGAMVAEYLFYRDTAKALKAAVGSTISFLSGIVFKVALGLFILIFFVVKVIS